MLPWGEVRQELLEYQRCVTIIGQSATEQLAVTFRGVFEDIEIAHDGVV